MDSFLKSFTSKTKWKITSTIYIKLYNYKQESPALPGNEIFWKYYHLPQLRSLGHPVCPRSARRRAAQPLLLLAGPLSSLDGPLAIVGRPPHCWPAPRDTGQDSCHDCRQIFVQLAKSSQLTETTFERGLTSGLWQWPRRILFCRFFSALPLAAPAKKTA